jgi:undecaprenyl diphosphate synthase
VLPATRAERRRAPTRAPAQDEAARQWGAELRVLGDLARAPPGVQAAAARLMRSSAALCERLPPGAPRRVVNVCFSYTSTEELGLAVARLRDGVAGCQLLRGDVDAPLLCSAMRTGAPEAGGSPPVDLMLRTSGEERLSDFLLWQSGGALLHWLPVLWPQLGFLDLLRALRAWQDARPALAALAAAARAHGAGMRAWDAADTGCDGGGWRSDDGGDDVRCRDAGGITSCRCEAPAPAPPPAPATARAPSSGLSSISEDAPSCAPHPSKQLRTQGFLSAIEAQRQAWICATLDRAEEGGGGGGGAAAGPCAAPPAGAPAGGGAAAAAAAAAGGPSPAEPDARPARDAPRSSRTGVGGALHLTPAPALVA